MILVTQPKSKIQKKKMVVDSDEEFEIDSDLLKDDNESDEINDEDLEDLVADIEDKKNPTPAFGGFKTFGESKKIPTQAFQPDKRKTEAVTNRLEKFGFSGAKKKTPTLSTKKPTFTSNKQISTKVPSFKEESKQGVMQKMTEDEIENGLPSFLHKDKIRDKNMLPQTDPNYDPSTLYIPQSEIAKCTPSMKQYWELKANNYDKVLLFKLGKFYEMFYDDAIVCVRVLDLNWMGGAKKYHVGFPEKALDKYVSILVNQGYKVAVVEQTETPKQLEKRNKASAGYKKEKCVARELCNIFSKGTYFDVNDGSYEPRWILVFSNDYQYNIGVAFFDITTLQFYVGQFQDNEMYSKFRTLAMQLRPIEIIYDKSQVSPQLIKILMNSPIPPVKAALPPKLCLNSFKSLAKLEGYMGEDKSKWSETLHHLHSALDQNDLSFTCLGMVISFLESTLNEKLLNLFYYSSYEPEKVLTSKMILDSQALEHLQILEVKTSRGITSKGSLFDLVDDTRTPFGKRLLKKWISAPLIMIEGIESRLDSVEDLINHPHEINVLRTKLFKLNDMEKQLSKLYQYSINKNKNAVYFEDVSLRKLKEFHDMLFKMKEIPDAISSLANVKDSLKSERLRQLVTIRQNLDDSEAEIEERENFEAVNDQNGLFPDLLHELQVYEDMVIWKRIGNEKVPEPAKGIDETFDQANELVNDIKKKLHEELERIKQKFSNDPNM
jgi:DNA mismatch repair protein MSH6